MTSDDYYRCTTCNAHVGKLVAVCEVNGSALIDPHREPFTRDRFFVEHQAEKQTEPALCRGRFAEAVGRLGCAINGHGCNLHDKYAGTIESPEMWRAHMRWHGKVRAHFAKYDPIEADPPPLQVDVARDELRHAAKDAAQAAAELRDLAKAPLAELNDAERLAGVAAITNLLTLADIRAHVTPLLPEDWGPAAQGGDLDAITDAVTAELEASNVGAALAQYCSERWGPLNGPSEDPTEWARSVLRGSVLYELEYGSTVEWYHPEPPAGSEWRRGRD